MAKPRFSSLSIAELAPMLERKKASPCDMAEDVLKRIHESNTRLNAYLYMQAETVREQARQAKREIRRGICRGPLHGIPFALNRCERNPLPLGMGSSERIL
jgi:Asp-tRNA(Asn)/Glu-tRNA(Gln) amidotransferase A subunit family amidase